MTDSDTDLASEDETEGIELPSSDNRRRYQTVISVVFITFACALVLGMLYVLAKPLEDFSIPNSGTIMEGQEIDTWEETPKMADQFDGSDVQTKIVKGKLYMQVKALREGYVPEIVSVRKQDDGSYVVYIEQKRGSGPVTKTLEIGVDSNLKKNRPDMFQSVEGITVEAVKLYD